MGATKSPKFELNQWLEAHLACVRQQSDRQLKPRLMLSGCIIDRLEILGPIEEHGMVVDHLCTGHCYLDGLVPQEGDPFPPVARRYLERVLCSRMIDQRRRLAYVHRLVDQYCVDGAIYHTLKSCDRSRYDYPLLKDELEDVGIPVLYL